MNNVARKYTRLILAVLMAAGCLLPPGYAGAAGPEDSQIANTGAGSKIAVVLAISGRPQGVIPISLPKIRAAGSNQLTVTLSEQGLAVIPPGRMLALMRQGRVRDGKSIPRDFLDSIAEKQSADLLLVANLVIQPGRLIMTGRYVDPVSATVLKVNMVERIIDQNPDKAEGEKRADWFYAIQEACKIIGAADLIKPPSGRETLLTLAAQPVGCSESTALTATHALLEHFVEKGQWDLIDPAVIVSTLQAAGYSGKYFGADARAMLRGTFNCSGLMIPSLISYDPDIKTTRHYDEYGDEDAPKAPLLSDFALSLRLIDLNSGSISTGKEVYLEVPANTGWFGVANKETLMTRLQATAGRLWSDIHSDLEDF